MFRENRQRKMEMDTVTSFYEIANDNVGDVSATKGVGTPGDTGGIVRRVLSATPCNL